MKRILGFVTVAVLIAVAHSYPPSGGLPPEAIKTNSIRVRTATTIHIVTVDPKGRVQREQEDVESIGKPNTDTLLVLPGHRFPVRPIFGDFNDDDDDALTPFGTFDRFPFRSNPFEGILNSMQDAMNRLREQMAGAIAGVGGLAPWGKIPEGANTTSTTKVIDGHVVTVNETVYKGEGDDDSFFRIRIIDVHPDAVTESDQSSGEVTEKSPDNQTTESTKEETTPARSVETVEDEKNEIPDSQVDTLKA